MKIFRKFFFNMKIHLNLPCTNYFLKVCVISKSRKTTKDKYWILNKQSQYNAQKLTEFTHTPKIYTISPDAKIRYASNKKPEIFG